jgi:hypothetical protein
MKANPMNPKNPPSAAKAIKIPRSSNNRADLQKINNPKTNQGSAELFKKGGDTMASKMNPGFMAMMAKKKDGMHKMPDGKMMKNSAMKMAGGGMPMVMKDGKKVPAFAADGEGKMKHGGMTKSAMPAALAKHAAKPASKAHAGLKAGGMTKMGSVKTNSKPDGVAQRGMTKGTQVTMKKGGKC